MNIGNSKKALSICNKPTVVSYAHHAYIHCIMENHENVGKELVRIYVPEANKSQWSYLDCDVNVEWEKNVCIINNYKNSNYTECAFFRKCKEEDEIIIEIQHFQYSNASAVINLVIIGGNIRDCICTDKNILRLGIIKKVGVYIKLNDKYCGLEKDDLINPRWIKLQRNNNQIYSWVSNDGETWICISMIELDETFDTSDLHIGINSNNGENQFYNWFYMNYLQLCYNNIDQYVYLDYYNTPRKSYGFNNLHQFMDFILEPICEIKEKYTSIHQYIKWHLIHDYYIEIGLDEYNVPERQSYHKEHFWHANLIYGYDDEKREYLSIGYNMRLEFSKISYEEMDEGIQNIQCNTNIKKIRYLPNDTTMYFNKEILKKNLVEFLIGENSSIQMGNLIPVQQGKYGLKVFDVLIEDERGRKLLFEDGRISFLIYEHSVIMQQRISYLIRNDILKDGETAIWLQDEINSIVEMTQNLKNIRIINQIKKSFDKDMLELVKKIKEKEKKLCECLIQSLSC